MDRKLMERMKKAEQYFHKETDKLVDELYSSGSPDVAGLSVKVYLLKGALSYALYSGDIDSGYNRIFSDMLTGITGELLKE